ncbi:TPA: AAA family ATPase, partial [Raoultella ornithinolytica]|nr:AAA family ATPase [Raoultella ornithinolytica]
MVNKLNIEECYLSFLALEEHVENEEYLKNSLEIERLKSAISEARFYLNKLAIHDFKRIRELQLTLEEDLTVFVGDNGFGKSSILESIAIALSWLRSNIEKENKPGAYIKLNEI